MKSKKFATGAKIPKSKPAKQALPINGKPFKSGVGGKKNKGNTRLTGEPPMPKM